MLGWGNLVVTNALVRGGARFHQARHEGGAVCMADGYARVSGRVGVCSVHQGPGLTNTITGLTEAAKSRTPVLVLAGDAPAAALTSNFRIDQHDLVESVGAIADRVHSPRTAADDAQRAYQRPDRAPAGGADAADRHPAPAGGLRSVRRSHRCRVRAPAPNPRAIEAARTRSSTRSGRRSSPAVARSSPTPARTWKPSAGRRARSSPRRRPPTACSPASHTRLGSPAASPRRSPPSCCPRPTR